MTKPLIGITTYSEHKEVGRPICAVSQSYIDAVVMAGGIPLLIPVNNTDFQPVELLQSVDGLLLTGGPDLNPATYGDKIHPEVKWIDSKRDEIDLSLAKYAIEQEMPYLGICRGFQVVNVVLGGKLYTHVNDQIENPLAHRLYPGYPEDLLSHAVKLEKDSLLAEIFQTEDVRVNSLHHQGLKEMGEGLLAVGTASDGLIEAIEKTDHPFGVAVQWHPELLTKHVIFADLFKAFVCAASKGSRVN